MYDRSYEIEMILNEEHTAILNYVKSIDEGIASMNRRVSALLSD